MSEKNRLLLLGADAESVSALTRVFNDVEFAVTVANSADEALDMVERGDFDLAIVDLARAEGADIVRDLRKADGSLQILAVSSSPASEEAAEALRRGAFNVLGRPLRREIIAELVQRALLQRSLAEENDALRRITSRPIEDGERIVAESPAMAAIIKRVQQIAASSTSVLLTGETGSGKGLVARAIHQMGGRPDSPFIHINCAALQEPLLESELFGHQKGAFTGAVAAKPGLFEVAHGGTLFLDEIGEMSPAMQAKLLQILDTGELRRVGATQTRRVDARILTATQKDLGHEARQGRFREDLLFRLNVVKIRVPPLRERREDIPALVKHYMRRFRPPDGRATKLSRRALQLLMEYHWSGNVRELANVMESVCLLAPGEKILPEDLPPHLQPCSTYESRAIDVPLPLAEVERLHILRALDYTDGKKAPAARLLGIDVKTLSNKIKSYKLEF